MSKYAFEAQHRFRASTVINDVQLWAGAYCIKVTKTYQETKEKSQYFRVVNGVLNNLYSPNDWALSVGFKAFYNGKDCIGLYKIFQEKDFQKEDLK